MPYIYGLVKDEGTGKPISNSTVTLKEGDKVVKEVTTDASGVWAIDDPATDSGVSSLYFYKDGYGSAAYPAPGWDNVPVSLYKLELSFSKIPVWVWIIIVLSIGTAGYLYFRKK